MCAFLSPQTIAEKTLMRRFRMGRLQNVWNRIFEVWKNFKNQRKKLCVCFYYFSIWSHCAWHDSHVFMFVPYDNTVLNKPTLLNSIFFWISRQATVINTINLNNDPTQRVIYFRLIFINLKMVEFSLATAIRCFSSNVLHNGYMFTCVCVWKTWSFWPRLVA